MEKENATLYRVNESESRYLNDFKFHFVIFNFREVHKADHLIKHQLIRDSSEPASTPLNGNRE